MSQTKQSQQFISHRSAVSMPGNNTQSSQSMLVKNNYNNSDMNYINQTQDNHNQISKVLLPSHAQMIANIQKRASEKISNDNKSSIGGILTTIPQQSSPSLLLLQQNAVAQLSNRQEQNRISGMSLGLNQNNNINSNKNELVLQQDHQPQGQQHRTHVSESAKRLLEAYNKQKQLLFESLPKQTQQLQKKQEKQEQNRNQKMQVIQRQEDLNGQRDQEKIIEVTRSMEGEQQVQQDELGNQELSGYGKDYEDAEEEQRYYGEEQELMEKQKQALLRQMEEDQNNQEELEKISDQGQERSEEEKFEVDYEGEGEGEGYVHDDGAELIPQQNNQKDESQEEEQEAEKEEEEQEGDNQEGREEHYDQYEDYDYDYQQQLSQEALDSQTEGLLPREGRNIDGILASTAAFENNNQFQDGTKGYDDECHLDVIQQQIGLREDKDEEIMQLKEKDSRSSRNSSNDDKNKNYAWNRYGDDIDVDIEKRQEYIHFTDEMVIDEINQQIHAQNSKEQNEQKDQKEEEQEDQDDSKEDEGVVVQDVSDEDEWKQRTLKPDQIDGQECEGEEGQLDEHAQLLCQFQENNQYHEDEDANVEIILKADINKNYVNQNQNIIQQPHEQIYQTSIGVQNDPVDGIFEIEKQRTQQVEQQGIQTNFYDNNEGKDNQVNQQVSNSYEQKEEHREDHDQEEQYDEDDDEEDFVRLYRKVNSNNNRQQDQVNKSVIQKQKQQSYRDAQTSPIKALEVRSRQSQDMQSIDNIINKQDIYQSSISNQLIQDDRRTTTTPKRIATADNSVIGQYSNNISSNTIQRRDEDIEVNDQDYLKRRRKEIEKEIKAKKTLKRTQHQIKNNNTTQQKNTGKQMLQQQQQLQGGIIGSSSTRGVGDNERQIRSNLIDGLNEYDDGNDGNYQDDNDGALSECLSIASVQHLAQQKRDEIMEKIQQIDQEIALRHRISKAQSEQLQQDTAARLKSNKLVIINHNNNNIARHQNNTKNNNIKYKTIPGGQSASNGSSSINIHSSNTSIASNNQAHYHHIAPPAPVIITGNVLNYQNTNNNNNQIISPSTTPLSSSGSKNPFCVSTTPLRSTKSSSGVSGQQQQFTQMQLSRQGSNKIIEGFVIANNNEGVQQQQQPLSSTKHTQNNSITYPAGGAGVISKNVVGSDKQQQNLNNFKDQEALIKSQAREDIKNQESIQQHYQLISQERKIEKIQQSKLQQQQQQLNKVNISGNSSTPIRGNGRNEEYKNTSAIPGIALNTKQQSNGNAKQGMFDEPLGVINLFEIAKRIKRDKQWKKSQDDNLNSSNDEDNDDDNNKRDIEILNGEEDNNYFQIIPQTQELDLEEEHNKRMQQLKQLEQHEQEEHEIQRNNDNDDGYVEDNHDGYEPPLDQQDYRYHIPYQQQKDQENQQQNSQYQPIGQQQQQKINSRKNKYNSQDDQRQYNPNIYNNNNNDNDDEDYNNYYQQINTQPRDNKHIKKSNKNQNRQLQQQQKQL